MSIFAKLTARFKLQPSKSMESINLENIKVSNTVKDSIPVFKDNKSLLIYKAKEEGITDKNELAMFLAQLDHESGGFKRLEENLNYRAEVLVKVFSRYFKDLDDAKKVVAQGKSAIADRIYGGRMGNTSPGDGYKYRGRGFIQLTGRNNYTKYQTITNLPLVNNPDILLNPLEAAVVSIAYWKNTPGIRPAAKLGDVITVSAIINTGSPKTPSNRINGLSDREMKFNKYLKEV